ncbi:MAG: site-2 protease family protein [Planctomycetes bacterium]|nr:site-2 protease family protein [Planctomycetota bacterium]
MKPAGSIRIFTILGINVYLHWTWVAWLIIRTRMDGSYRSPAWSVAEFLALFGIVLLHEFGHALATRSVGGRAERIVLWPLGGVAFVDPPPRPGAVLWSIAAGPLVNVLLMPVLFVFAAWMGVWSGPTHGVLPFPDHLNALADPQRFAFYILFINFILLVFNMLPVYPLDGGQILQALLWFPLGRPLSLRIAAGIGLLAAATGFVWAMMQGETYMMVMAGFLGWQAFNGWRVANMMAMRERYERDMLAGGPPPV